MVQSQMATMLVYLQSTQREDREYKKSHKKGGVVSMQPLLL